MTETDAVKLELTRGKLGQRTWVFNHFRGLCPKRQVCGKWEWLPAGTEVAVDKDGRPWYKWDCSNRLFLPVGQSPSWWSFGGGGPQWPSWLPWLLLLPLFGLLAYIFGRLWREERERWGPLPPRPRPGNGGNGRGPDPDLSGPAALRLQAAGIAPPAPAVDRAAVRRAALEQKIAVQTAVAAAHEVKAARLSQEGRAANDDAEAEQKLREAHLEREAAKSARAAVAAKKAELDSLGPTQPVAPAPPTPVPTSTPQEPASDEKTALLVLLRAAEKEAGIRHRALRVAIDAMESGTMAPDEVRGWLRKLSITL